MKKHHFILPYSGKKAILLDNLFNKYLQDPVFLKLQRASNIFAQKTNYSILQHTFNKDYFLGGGGRAEELRIDLLKEIMPNKTYNLINSALLTELISLLDEKRILTASEEKLLRKN